PFRLLLPRSLYAEMLAHARAELPNECCGLLAGRIAAGGTESCMVVRCYALLNELASPTEFLSEPMSRFRAEKEMRKEGLDWLAFYLPPPAPGRVPSRTDLARNFWGSDVVHFIISLKGDEPLMRGWRLREDRFDEAEWELV